MADVLMAIADCLIQGRLDLTTESVRQALDEGLSPETILEAGLQAGMSEVGRRFETNEIFVPEMIRSGKCMTRAIEVLAPHLTGSGTSNRGKVVLGTVAGDGHDIGKNLVGLMLRGTGYQVIDLGVEQPPEAFAAAVKEHRPDIVGLSALLNTTMPMLGQTIGVLSEAGLRDRVKVIVGGAPVTPEYARASGADGYAPNAGAAVKECKRLLQGYLPDRPARPADGSGFSRRN